MSKEVFKILKDGEEVEIAVVMPNAQQSQEASIHAKQVFAKAVKSKCLFRKALEKFMLEQGIWNEEKEIQKQKLLEKIAYNTNKLESGGIKLSDARILALQIKTLREELRNLIAESTSLDANTIEGQSDNARFEYLVSCCTVYNSTGERYYRDLDDYYAKQDDMVQGLASYKLMSMLYGVNSGYEYNLPENQFLQKFKFVDDKLRLINKDGHLIDDEGRLIDENYNYVNEQNEFVDKFGNKLNKKDEEVLPFLDDDGNPIG